MQQVHLQSIDLNLLVTLYALLEERHVTRAARRCFLSQPAMSRAFERLRGMLDDPLLVRSGRGYQRTVRGERLLHELESLIPRLEALIRGEEFDPRRSRERFRMGLTDHASAVLLPPLLERLRAEAPGIALDVSLWQSRVYEDVAAGRLDIALSAEAVPVSLRQRSSTRTRLSVSSAPVAGRGRVASPSSNTWTFHTRLWRRGNTNRRRSIAAWRSWV